VGNSAIFVLPEAEDFCGKSANAYKNVREY
jgi:hypothetical protein